MNPSFNKQLHSLLTSTGLMPQKRSLVFGFTKGRSESSKDMNDGEAKDLINWLREQPSGRHKVEGTLRQAQSDKANRMRRRIISMAHEMGWHNLVDGHWVADMRAIDTWCVLRSYLKKDLNKYTADELPKLVSQFERVYKSYLKKF